MQQRQRGATFLGMVTAYAFVQGIGIAAGELVSEHSVQGVQSVNADAQTKLVTVAFDAPATEEEIVALLKEINYAPALN